MARESAPLNITAAGLTALLLLAASGAGRAAGRGLPPDARYPYNGPTFRQWVRDSYALAPHGARLTPFAVHFDRRARQFGVPQGVDAYLKTQAAVVAAAKDPEEKTRRQLVLAQSLHRLIKKSITRFSLDRGYEFASVVATGERQCLLQSVLLASLLQKAGVPGGTVMVWRGETGDASNLGHVVTLMQTATGRDVLVDCSERHPFPRHLGLFLPDAQTRQYRFVVPTYTSAPPSAPVLPRTPPSVATTPLITGYTPLNGGRPVSPSVLRPLSVAYLSSQFDYYRGERVPGGMLAPRPNLAALRRAAFFWERSVKTCPQNPLATYQLGRVQARLGQTTLSARHLQTAYRLYKTAGYVPPTAVEMVALNRTRGGQPPKTRVRDASG